MNSSRGLACCGPHPSPSKNRAGHQWWWAILPNNSAPSEPTRPLNHRPKAEHRASGMKIIWNHKRVMHQGLFPMTPCTHLSEPNGNVRTGKEHYFTGSVERSATETSGPGKIPSKTAPATAQAKTNDTWGERTSLVCNSCSEDGSRIYITITMRK